MIKATIRRRRATRKDLGQQRSDDGDDDECGDDATRRTDEGQRWSIWGSDDSNDDNDEGADDDDATRRTDEGLRGAGCRTTEQCGREKRE